jgi:transcriptional regulator with XRE-family HTH domain
MVGGTAMHLSEAVAMRIAYFCKEKSLSINKLSIQCGLRQSTVSNILNGTSKNPTIASIKKICDGLEIPLSDFFDDPIFSISR